MGKFFKLLQTDDHVSGLICRLTLGMVMLPHGLQLLLGWFGGYGFGGSMDYFTQTKGMPWILGFLVVMIQVFGSAALLLGFAGRLMAFGMLLIFAGMVFSTHTAHFFMNWHGDQQGEGFEYHILAMGLSLVVLLKGSGKYSADRLLTVKRA
jgi:putative oxidoreductase